MQLLGESDRAALRCLREVVAEARQGLDTPNNNKYLLLD